MVELTFDRILEEGNCKRIYYVGNAEISAIYLTKIESNDAVDFTVSSRIKCI